MISCLVTESRCYLQDLPQEGVEIPCKLVLSGEKEYVNKARKILDPILSATGESASPPMALRVLVIQHKPELIT